MSNSETATAEGLTTSVTASCRGHGRAALSSILAAHRAEPSWSGPTSPRTCGSQAHLSVPTAAHLLPQRAKFLSNTAHNSYGTSIWQLLDASIPQRGCGWGDFAPQHPLEPARRACPASGARKTYSAHNQDTAAASPVLERRRHRVRADGHDLLRSAGTLWCGGDSDKLVIVEDMT